MKHSTHIVFDKESAELKLLELKNNHGIKSFVFVNKRLRGTENDDNMFQARSVGMYIGKDITSNKIVFIKKFKRITMDNVLRILNQYNINSGLQYENQVNCWRKGKMWDEDEDLIDLSCDSHRDPVLREQCLVKLLSECDTDHVYGDKQQKIEHKIEREAYMQDYFYKKHPDLSTPIKLYGDDKYIYLISDMIMGIDLIRFVDYLHENKEEVLIYLIHKIHELLVFLIDNNITHCDFRLQNIVITPSGQLKLIDFEYARLFGEEPKEMAKLPEFGPVHCNDLSDIYSYGRILEYMFTKDFRPINNTGRIQGRLNIDGDIFKNSDNITRYINNILSTKDNGLTILGKKPFSRLIPIRNEGQVKSIINKIVSTHVDQKYKHYLELLTTHTRRQEKSAPERSSREAKSAPGRRSRRRQAKSAPGRRSRRRQAQSAPGRRSRSRQAQSAPGRRNSRIRSRRSRTSSRKS